MHDRRRSGRRTADVIVSLLALILLSPIFALVAISVAIDSGLPILFRQTRVGKGGRPFLMLKFRTMRPSNGGMLLTVKGDPRVTRLGSLLRKTKLDELPQFVNVLKGEMTLV